MATRKNRLFSFFLFSKYWIKRIIASFLYGSGILNYISRSRLQGKAVVLMYHRVLSTEESNKTFSHPGIVVNCETFRRHIELLNEYFSPLTLEQFEQHMLSGDSFPNGACLVTFDDGWIDNYTNALPILQDLKVPAAVFAATDYIGTDNAFWQERLGYLLYTAVTLNVEKEILEKHGIVLSNNLKEDELRSEIGTIVEWYRKQDYEFIFSLIADLEETLRESGYSKEIVPYDLFMDWKQINSIIKGGVTVASHSCSHRILTRLDTESIDYELNASRQTLKDRLGHEVTAMAYPNGDFDDTVRKKVYTNGYRLAFTTQDEFTDLTTDRLLIPRINMHELATSTDALFLCRVLRVF